MSSLTHAREVMNTDNISFNTEFYCFNVKGTSGHTRVVTLFPKETCSCPATGEYYHLLAVRMSLRMTEFKKRIEIQLNTVKKKQEGQQNWPKATQT